jgi:hypothetical protein
MTLGFAHLRFVLVIAVSVLVYLLAESYNTPLEAVLLFVCVGAVLAGGWDKLKSFAT